MANDQAHNTATTEPLDRATPDVSLSVAGVASGGVLPYSYQLASGQFSARNVDPILIYPRPDAETAAWTKHRRHYPGIGYRVPIGVSFGSGPLVYEIISSPAGATIGEFLVISGDTLIPNEDYGVLKWANPTAGNHSFQVRVSFQDGFTPVDVYWTLEVTTAGTIFIDAVNGNDATGDGSLNSPFQTINAWWKGDLSDTTYSEFQVCYRGGTHNIAATNINTGVSDGNWQLNGTDKPLVHYAYPNERVIFDFSSTTVVFGISAPLTGVHCSDWYFGEIECAGGRINTANTLQFAIYSSGSAEVYSSGGAAQRMTFDAPIHRDMIPEVTSSNNSACIFTPNAGTGNKRHFFYVHRPTFESVAMADSVTESNVNFNGYYLSSIVNLLAEHVTCINTEFGRAPIMSKSGGINWCIRFADCEQSPEQPFFIDPTGSYDTTAGGPVELSYAKVKYNGVKTADIAMMVNTSLTAYDENNPDHYPVYVTRSSFSRIPVANRSAFTYRAGWPVLLDGVLVVADSLIYLGPDSAIGATRYDIADDPFDASMSLLGAERQSQLGLIGHEIKA